MNGQNPVIWFVFFSKRIFLILFIVLLLQGCQGEIPSDVSVEIMMETKSDGRPYLSLVEKNNSKVFNLNGFYEMEDLIPDLSFEKETSIAGNTYIISSLFAQIPEVGLGSPDKKFYEYYLEVYNDERILVNLSYIHRDTESDWSTVFDKSFSHLNQEGYSLLTFQDQVSGMDCIVRGSYNLFCRSGERTQSNDSYQAIAITKTRLIVGNREYIAGDKVLTAAKGSEYLITAKVVDWNMDGHFDNNDRVSFTMRERALFDDEYFILGEKIEIPAMDLITNPSMNGMSRRRRYVLDLSPTSSRNKYILKIKAAR